MTWLILAVIVVLVAATVVLYTRRRSVHNSVDSFRRQIDALGPAARRSVVDKLQQTGERPTGDEQESDDGT